MPSQIEGRASIRYKNGVATNGGTEEPVSFFW